MPTTEAELEQQLATGPFYDEDHSPSGNPTDEQIEMFLSGISLGAVAGSIVGTGVNVFVAAADLGTPLTDLILYGGAPIPVDAIAAREALTFAEAQIAKALIASGQAGGIEEVQAFITAAATKRFIAAGLSDAAAQLAADAEAQTVMIRVGQIVGAVEAALILAGAAKNEQAAMAVFFGSGLK